MINLRDLLILNLTLQVFDGLFSYQVFSLGAAEANPFVSAAIATDCSIRKFWLVRCCCWYLRSGTACHCLLGED
jgi:hypothetical protein